MNEGTAGGTSRPAVAPMSGATGVRTTRALASGPAPAPRPRPRRSLAPWLLAAWTSLAAVGSAQGDPAPPAGAVARGVEVYRANYCGACHALRAAGTAGAFGPSHEAMAATAAERLRYADYGGAAVTPEEYLLESIVDPAAYLVPGFLNATHPMPSFAHLAKEDLDALIAMLLAQ